MDKQNSAWCMSVDLRPPGAPGIAVQGLPPSFVAPPRTPQYHTHSGRPITTFMETWLL